MEKLSPISKSLSQLVNVTISPPLAVEFSLNDPV